MRETLGTRYPLQERSGNFLLVTLAPTAAQGMVNELFTHWIELAYTAGPGSIFGTGTEMEMGQSQLHLTMLEWQPIDRYSMYNYTYQLTS